MICPTAIEAAKRILDAVREHKPAKPTDAIAVAIELLATVGEADSKSHG